MGFYLEQNSDNVSANCICSFYISFNSLGSISVMFIGTSRRVQLARKCRLDVSTSGSSRSSTSLVREINVRKHHLLAWYTLTANKIHSFLCRRTATNFLEANIADLNFRGRLKTKQKSAPKNSILVVLLFFNIKICVYICDVYNNLV